MPRCLRPVCYSSNVAHSKQANRCCDSRQTNKVCSDFCTGSLPRKAFTALAWYWQSQMCCDSTREVKAHTKVASCATLERGRKRYLGRPKLCGKTPQLSTVMLSFVSKAASRKQEALHKRLQRTAAWTSSPLTEVEAVQSAKLCFQCNKLQCHTQHCKVPVHSL